MEESTKVGGTGLKDVGAHPIGSSRPASVESPHLHLNLVCNESDGCGKGVRIFTGGDSAMWRERQAQWCGSGTVGGVLGPFWVTLFYGER